VREYEFQGLEGLFGTVQGEKYMRPLVVQLRDRESDRLAKRLI
jgi:hypothetical protein